MRIYKNTKKQNSFLAANPDKQLVSTRSGYPESFMEKMADGSYTYFDKHTSGAKTITEEVVVFPERVVENIDGFTSISKTEIYEYVGCTENKAELLNLLK